MRWQRMRQSRNVEDRRGMRVSGPVRMGGLGLGGLALILLLGYVTGSDPLQLLSDVSRQMDTGGPPAAAPPGGAPTDEAGRFASAIFGDAEDTWTTIFDNAGRRYTPATLVLFDDAVQSACGFTSSAVGPFYCPADSKVYIDLAFFRELGTRFGAPGDFAQAYVIAHEVGHHIQNVTGVFEAVSRQRGQANANELSIRQELQADCFAGVWGHYAAVRDLLEPGDVEDGLAAAAAIGDDRIQRQGQGYVTPESWTHGSSAQRVEWLRRGLQSGDMNACDTFGGG
ncbi:MAG TPA: neutral zinc metallopeptidase [Vicinamibacterales bacterium]|nr:neutral zinc metallopeptidase [Vicinamibacterales bacterium]